MGTVTLHRCDNCGKTQENKTGWFEVGIADSLFIAFSGGMSFYGNEPSATKVLVCSFGCARGWLDTSAEEEWEKIKPGAIVASEPQRRGRRA